MGYKRLLNRGLRGWTRMGKINVGKYKTTDYADGRGWGTRGEMQGNIKSCGWIRMGYKRLLNHGLRG
jgi:hypothetical protein